IIVSAAPPGNTLRVREIAVYPDGSVPVPSRQGGQYGSQQRARGRADARGTEVRIELIPRVAHRRMAIAEVQRSWTHDRPFGHAMAAAEDEIERLEIELLDERGKERQAFAVVVTHAGQALQRRRVNRQTLDRGGHRSADVQQREQLGARIALAEHLEHLLAAAHARQPVVNDGDFHELTWP